MVPAQQTSPSQTGKIMDKTIYKRSWPSVMEFCTIDPNCNGMVPELCTSTLKVLWRIAATVFQINKKQNKQIYSVSQKNGPLRLIWHNFTNSQHSLITFGTDILKDYVKKFLHWLRTSCAVSITTVTTWRSVSQKNWTAKNTRFWHNLIKRSLI